MNKNFTYLIMDFVVIFTYRISYGKVTFDYRFEYLLNKDMVMVFVSMNYIKGLSIYR